MLRRVSLLPVAALLLFGAAMALAACGNGPIEDPQKVVVAERVQFTIPGDLTSNGISGIDSVVGRWSNADLQLLLDYGQSSDPLGNKGKDAFRLTLTTIDGEKATIERFTDAHGDPQRPYVAAIHFDDTGDGTQLTIFGRASTEDGQDLLMEIFDTIQWVDA